MAYTIKKLAKLSGVTVRTLRWYDEIGLLKPTYHGENGYRYYETNELLTLQHILFFRELGFKLDEIKRILRGDDFNQIKTLLSHKKTLAASLDRTKKLIETIDKTILYLRGNQIMEDKEMYNGFNEWKKGKGSESYFIGTCEDPSSDPILKHVKKNHSKNWTKEDYEKHVEKNIALYKKLIVYIEKGLSPESDEVQNIIKTLILYMETSHIVSRDLIQAYAKAYREKPEYKKQIDPFHPELATFMANAMDLFAQKNYS